MVRRTSTHTLTYPFCMSPIINHHQLRPLGLLVLLLVGVVLVVVGVGVVLALSCRTRVRVTWVLTWWWRSGALTSTR